jgi:hypothetical protein
MPLYVLDTNIFIQAHRSTYPLDIATSFWNLIKQLAEDEKIISIDKVKDEIEENEDELNDWIQANLPDGFFKDTNQGTVLSEYGLMAPWAESRADHYQRGAIDEFLDFYNADAWLVAYCKSTGHTLVTQEVSNPNQKNRIPIPEACKAFDVAYCNMIEMFRELGVRF